MSKKAWAVAATLCVSAVCGTSAQAAVKSYDLGAIPVGASSAYTGTTGTGSFTVYEKFSFGTAPVDASVSYSDTVRFATNAITGGVLSLFSCSSNCTGTALAPTGTLITSSPLINLGTTQQVAGFGPVTLATAGAYFLEITGSTKASAPGVTYAGTISLDSVAGGVPEPSTWAMMLIGFAGLAFAYGSSNRANSALA
ncbi:hypothetical protein ES708_16581 [subsurface metagenome]